MENAVRLLLIEDSEADADLITLCLRESDPFPFELVVANSLSEGLDRLGEFFHLVLLDLILPDSTPEETFDRLHEAAPELPVVVVSAAGDDRVAKRCIEHGATAYLDKGSVAPQALGAAVRGAIQRSRGA